MQDENTLEEIAESLPEHLADDFGATWAFIATYHMVWPFGSQNAVSHTIGEINKESLSLKAKVQV